MSAEELDQLLGASEAASTEQQRLLRQIRRAGIEVITTSLEWEPEGPVIVIYVTEPWTPPADTTHPVRIIEAEPIDREALEAELREWSRSEIGMLLGAGASIDLAPPGRLELFIDESYEQRIRVERAGESTVIELLPTSDDPTAGTHTVDLPATVDFASGEGERPEG